MSIQSSNLQQEYSAQYSNFLLSKATILASSKMYVFVWASFFKELSPYSCCLAPRNPCLIMLHRLKSWYRDQQQILPPMPNGIHRTQ